MGRKRQPMSEKIKTLPARYRPEQRLLSWDIEWDSALGVRITSELAVLAADLGGWETLSRQRQILVEKAVFLYLKTSDYESALLRGDPPPFDAGAYSNKVNVLLGHLRQLGLDRVAKSVRGLREIMGGPAA